MGSWIYQRIAPGEFRKVPYTAWQKFLNGEAPLQPSADGFVWTASLWMALEDRKVVGIHALYLGKSRARPDGIHDEAMRKEAMSAGLLAAWEAQAELESRALAKGQATESAKTVNAQARFDHNRFRWKATPADVETLCALVNQRAGWRVLRGERFEGARKPRR